MEYQSTHILMAIWCSRGHLHPIEFHCNESRTECVRPVLLDPEYVVAADIVNWKWVHCEFQEEFPGTYNYCLTNYPPRSMKILWMSRDETEPSSSDQNLPKKVFFQKIQNEAIQRLKSLDENSDSVALLENLSLANVQPQQGDKEASSVVPTRSRSSCKKKEKRVLKFLKEKYLERDHVRIEWYGGKWDYLKEAPWVSIGEVKLPDVRLSSARKESAEYHVYYTPELENNVASFSSVPRAQQHRVKHLPTGNVVETFPHVSEYLVQTPYGDGEFISCKRWAKLDLKLGNYTWKDVFFVITENWNDTVVLGSYFGRENITYYINNENSEQHRVHFRNGDADLLSSRFERYTEPGLAKELITVDRFRSYCNDTEQF